MNIIILHGLYMHGLVMLPLSKELKSLGYETRTLTYNSVAINEKKLFEKITRALRDDCDNVLVGHSLGGLIIKRYLSTATEHKMKISHVVTIGSPLQGASVVTKIQKLGMGMFLGNAASHGLEEHQDKWQFSQKLGSIAGTIPIGVRPLLLMRGKSDGTVTLEETKIDGMSDHIEIKSSHTSIIYSSEVPSQIHHFITTNTFKH